MEVFFVGIIIALVVCLLLLFIVPTLTVAGGLIALVVGLLAQTYDAIEAGVRRWNGGGRDDGHPLFANAYWVIPGRFAAGEYPRAKDFNEAAPRLWTLLRAGIDHFIDLTEPGELEPYDGILAGEARVLGTSATHERHPIRDVSVPRSPSRMETILDAIDDALAEERNVYVHCWGGVGRTGTVVGCWLVRHGRTGDEALAQVADWWQSMEKADHRHSPETREQRNYVRDWAEPPPEESR